MTDRIALTDGRWFDKGAAEEFIESAYVRHGNGLVRRASGSTCGEILYRTAGGAWVLNKYSDTSDTYEEITATEAATWLVRNRYEPHAACASEFAELELT